MVYSDIKKFNLHNILKQQKQYNTKSKKLRKQVQTAILNNKDFIQFALKSTNEDYINNILGKLITFIIKCNDCYYNYELQND